MSWGSPLTPAAIPLSPRAGPVVPASARGPRPRLHIPCHLFSWLLKNFIVWKVKEKFHIVESVSNLQKSFEDKNSTKETHTLTYRLTRLAPGHPRTACLAGFLEAVRGCPARRRRNLFGTKLRFCRTFRSASFSPAPSNIIAELRPSPTKPSVRDGVRDQGLDAPQGQQTQKGLWARTTPHRCAHTHLAHPCPSAL